MQHMSSALSSLTLLSACMLGLTGSSDVTKIAASVIIPVAVIAIGCAVMFAILFFRNKKRLMMSAVRAAWPLLAVWAPSSLPNLLGLLCPFTPHSQQSSASQGELHQNDEGGAPQLPISSAAMPPGGALLDCRTRV